MNMTIEFEYQTTYGIFRDALHLPDDHGLSQEQIQAMQEERLNNWLAIVDSASNFDAEQTPAQE
jgi:hypothetical protein